MNANNDEIDLSIYDDVPPARQSADVEMTPADVMNRLTGESGMGRRYEDSVLGKNSRTVIPPSRSLVRVPVKSVAEMLSETRNNRPFLTTKQREMIGTAVKSSSRGMILKPKPKPKPSGGATRKKRRLNKMKRMKTKRYNKSRARKSTCRRYKNSH